MAITNAVVPVGGLGTRLLPATRSQPKEMLPIVDRPVVQYVVEELARAGVQRLLLVTGRRKRAIEDHFDAAPEVGAGPLFGPGSGPQIFYTRQAHPAGLGDALRYARGFADGEPLIVALGDAIIDTPASAAPGIVARLVQAYERTHATAALAVWEVPEEAVSRYGVAIPAGDDALSTGEPHTLEALIEKPDPGEVRSRTAVMGRYVLGPAVLDALDDQCPDESGEVQLTAALQSLIDGGERVIAVRLGPGERRHDIGSLESYCATFLEHALRDPRLGRALRSRAAALLDEG